MKLIIAGSRNITDYEKLLSAVKLLEKKPSEILSGTAKGVDSMGERWAKENNITVVKYPANWDKYGKSAGYRRNVEMAENADALLLIWDGESKGSKHMLDIAQKKDMAVYVYAVYNARQVYVSQL
jgi:hypothetical protein